MTIELPVVLLAFNVVFGIAAFFGGVVIRGLLTSVKDLQAGQGQIVKDLGGYATKADVSEVRTEQRDTLREMRDEQRQSFSQVFNRLDGLMQQVAQKADRSEVR